MEKEKKKQVETPKLTKRQVDAIRRNKLIKADRGITITKI